MTAKKPGVVTITAKTEDGGFQTVFTLTVKKKVIIVIGASQVGRMCTNEVFSYNRGNNSYSVSTPIKSYCSDESVRVLSDTLHYIYKGGSGFSYQTGAGWEKAKEVIQSYSSSKDYVEFYVFFPIAGNEVLVFDCNEISSNNSKIKDFVSNYNDVITKIKNSGYNVKAIVVSVHPVKASQSTSEKVVVNQNANSCKATYRSNLKYYTFNTAIGTIINTSYKTNLTYEYLFDKIMKTNDEGKNFSYLVTYNTTDGVHWDKETAEYYLKLMLDNATSL